MLRIDLTYVQRSSQVTVSSVYFRQGHVVKAGSSTTVSARRKEQEKVDESLQLPIVTLVSIVHFEQIVNNISLTS